MRAPLAAALGALCLTLAAAAAPATPLVDRLPLSAMSEAIDAGRYQKIEAVLVERDGQTLFEDYYRRSGPETRIDARSAGKSITALAVGIAIDQGALPGVDARLLDFFPDRGPIRNDGPAKRAIVIGDLLSMSSALDCNDWRGSPGNEERMYRAPDWTRFALDIPLDRTYGRNPADGQGRFSYCTAGVFLLGRVVERATGERFDAFVQRKLFGPLGIDGAIWRRAPGGEAQSGGQLSLRARDFAAIGRLVLDGGDYRGGSLISRDWLRKMLQPRVRATPRDGYAYLWWVRDFRASGTDKPYPGFFMHGNGGNKVVLFPDLDATVVILATNYNRSDMDEQTTALIEDHILPALLAAPASSGH